MATKRAGKGDGKEEVSGVQEMNGKKEKNPEHEAMRSEQSMYYSN